MKLARDDARTHLRTISDQEPVFPIRAQDIQWRDAIHAWAAGALKIGVPVATVEQALQLCDAGEAWPVKKIPGDDHIDPEQRAALEASFALRGFDYRPDAVWAAREMAVTAARSEGFAAGVRSMDAPLKRLQDQVADYRREIAGLEAKLGARSERGDEEAMAEFKASLRGAGAAS